MAFTRSFAASFALVFCVATQAQAETIQVVIDKLVFSPASITAKVGDTIEWVNKDAFAHTATVKGSWEVMIPPKKTVAQQLDKVETVDFYCRFHPNMKGSLIVKAD
ncbi:MULTISPECIES: cupredoxin domain-containing protein [Mesorhizobium]|uniref:Amicyanin n=1 Tax=Mesorhizobium denitrificans TaxID=2294114 RepID=A0A371X400_9HYPH|nr:MULTISPECIES: cupredoxin family copper-binding protein [Mesorhizobium]RFC63929.1 amicyanin [Mesorhizobium denitrificans]